MAQENSKKDFFFLIEGKNVPDLNLAAIIKKRSVITRGSSLQGRVFFQPKHFFDQESIIDLLTAKGFNCFKTPKYTKVEGNKISYMITVPENLRFKYYEISHNATKTIIKKKETGKETGIDNSC